MDKNGQGNMIWDSHSRFFKKGNRSSSSDHMKLKHLWSCSRSSSSASRSLTRIEWKFKLEGALIDPNHVTIDPWTIMSHKTQFQGDLVDLQGMEVDLQVYNFKVAHFLELDRAYDEFSWL